MYLCQTGYFPQKNTHFPA
uniref:Uncharacterized protein n=1 Tax=Anguilla anguilla TaxID=7936 RepID=A0A0E9SF23_ANGAN